MSKNDHDLISTSENSELEYCHKCGGSEGTLPTDCPNEWMTREQSDAVYAGNYDFRKEEGWVYKLSPMGEGMIKSLIFDMLNGREGCLESDAEIILRVGTTKEEYLKVKSKVLKYLSE